MIAKKVFNADGNNKRFLSDFIIQSEQFARVYVYIYDETLNPDGTEDQLQNGSTNQADFSFPDNIWKRGEDVPDSGDDLITIDKWDLVTNSILMYDAPLAPSKIWIEVATTPEEFGDTLTQPSVERAETAADTAVASAIAAGESETASAASASSASTSETNAGNSASAASISETNAGNSASSASTSETNAGNSETAAAASEASSAGSASAASTSETNAGNSEAAAAGSASAASTSETNAGNSETAAAVSAASVNIRAVDDIADLPLTPTEPFHSIVVKDSKRGGIFIYDATKVNINDNGVHFNGWVRQIDGVVTAYMFGAVGDGVVDDIQALQDAMAYSSAYKVKFRLTDGTYNIAGDDSDINNILGLPTASDLHMEWTGNAWIKPSGRSRVGAILTNVLANDVIGSFQSNITLDNPQMDLINMPLSAATLTNDNAIGFARSAHDVTINGGHIKNVHSIFKTGIGGTGGKGINFEHGAYNCKVTGTIRFDNCYTGLYINGLFGTQDGYDKGVTRISVDTVVGENCGSLVTIGSSDSTQVTPDDSLTNNISVSRINYYNCGYGIERSLEGITPKIYQKSGVVNLSGARNVTIGEIEGFNDSTYAPYSTIVDTDNIGYGLTNHVGAVVWGHGNNISIGSVICDGRYDSLLHLGMAYAIGDSNPPETTVSSISNFSIASSLVKYYVARIVEGDVYYPQTDNDVYDVRINLRLGKNTIAPIAFTDSISQDYNNLYMNIVNSSGGGSKGSANNLNAVLASPEATSVTHHSDSLYFDKMPLVDGDFIMEVVSNGNGLGYKFNSGLLVCTKSVVLDAPTFAAGAIFASAGNSTTYAVPFVGSIPSVTAANSTSTTQWYGASSTLTAATIRTLSYISGSSLTWSIAAIGRWK